MPRQRKRDTSPETRFRNMLEAQGRPAIAGLSRVGVVDSIARALAPSAIEQSTGGAESTGSARLLALSATGVSIEPGGDYVSFGAVLAQQGFIGVAPTSNGYWVHPVTGVYMLEYEHAWDTFRGGLVQLEVDDVVPTDGTIAHDGHGRRGRGDIMYHATAGSVGRIKITHSDAAAQTCSAIVRVAITDPSTADTAGEWVRVMSGDIYDLWWDGSNWWTTEGFTGATVSKRSADGTIVGSFEASTALARGLVMVDGDLWVCGDNAFVAGGNGTERIVSHDAAGTNLLTVTTGSSDDGNTGLTWDGSHLWLLEANGAALERWTTDGVFVDSFAITAGQYRDVAYYGGHLYAVNTSNDLLTAFTTAGAEVRSIDISGAASGATGVFIDADGSLYIAKEGDGAWRYAQRLGVL